jgi:hypothetical protein
VAAGAGVGVSARRIDLRYRSSMTIARTAAWTLRALALLAALAAAGSCRSTPDVPPPDAAIVGTWRAADGSVSVDFSQGGLYSIALKDRPRPVMGSFAFDPKEGTLALTTRRESPVCGDDDATYRVRIGGMTMDLEVQRDTCDLRARSFAVPLERVRGGR